MSTQTRTRAAALTAAAFGLATVAAIAPAAANTAAATNTAPASCLAIHTVATSVDTINNHVRRIPSCR